METFKWMNNNLYQIKGACKATEVLAISWESLTILAQGLRSWHSQKNNDVNSSLDDKNYDEASLFKFNGDLGAYLQVE